MKTATRTLKKVQCGQPGCTAYITLRNPHIKAAVRKGAVIYCHRHGGISTAGKGGH